MSQLVQELERHDPRDVGPYRLLGKLGAGGMGQVYLAAGPAGPVAVKIVNEWLADNDEFRDRFAREVALSRLVDSPWTARVVDADTDAAMPWLAIDYIRGVPLDRAVGAAGPLPAASVHVLAADLAGALAAIHAAGLVHRDVKPANVMLATDRPVLIDFGIARALEGTRMTTTGVTIGTPAFMSPEQAEGLDVGAASDVFSLGSVLVHAATGRGPFGEGTPLAVLRRIRTDVPDLGGLAEPVRGLVARCLRRDPADRPSAAELGAALEPLPAIPREGWLPAAVAAMLPALPVAPVAVPPVPRIEPASAVEAEQSRPRSRRVSRRALLFGFGAVGVVGAGVGIRLALGGGGPERPLWTFPMAGVRDLTPGDGVVYARGGDNAEVRALDMATGQQRWAFTTRAEMSRPAAVTAGVVSVSDGHAAYALDGASGRLLWEAEDTTVFGAASGLVIAYTRDYRPSEYRVLVGLDALTGARRWTCQLEDLSVTDVMAVGAGGAYVASRGRLVALDVGSGAVRWQYLRHPDDRIKVQFVGDVVLSILDTITTGPGDVVALDAATGAQRWQRAPEQSTSGFAVEGESVYVKSPGSLESWRADTGETRWRTENEPLSLVMTRLAATADAWYMGGSEILSDNPEFALYAFSASSGRLRWRLPLDHGYDLSVSGLPLTAVPGTVFLATPDAVHAVPER
jgi:outer membrane protein assembly factor BamB/predicted Ser/Thr protein kinase